jgi:hemerythrin superfamily protein
MPTPETKDACGLLDADHIAVKHLFVEYARLAMAPPGAAGERQAIAEKICGEITVHARIEEEIFYPALREAIDSPQLLDEAEAEHQEAKDLIARIQRAKRPGPDLDDLVSQLARSIERHVKEERDHLFPKARSAPGMDLVALGAQLQERQQELKAQIE